MHFSERLWNLTIFMFFWIVWTLVLLRESLSGPQPPHTRTKLALLLGFGFGHMGDQLLKGGDPARLLTTNLLLGFVFILFFRHRIASMR